MKAHVGMDSRSKLIRSVAATAANVHGSQLLPDLPRGGETRIWGDSTYSEQSEAICKHASRAKDFTQKKGSRCKALMKAERARSCTRCNSEPQRQIARIRGSIFDSR